MVLEGVVTNVTKFGAFVDIGVHQDGLVHISELSNRFIKDPSEAVKAGQIVKVKVLSADLKAKRIALSMKPSWGPLGTTPRRSSQVIGRHRSLAERETCHAFKQVESVLSAGNRLVGESLDSSGLFGSDDSDAGRLGNLLDLSVSRTESTLVGVDSALISPATKRSPKTHRTSLCQRAWAARPTRRAWVSFREGILPKSVCWGIPKSGNG